MPRYGKRRRTRKGGYKRLYKRFKRKFKRRSKKVGYKQNRKYLRIKCSYQFDVHADTAGITKYCIPVDNPQIGHYHNATSHTILLHPFEYLRPIYDYYRCYGIKLKWESNVKNSFTQFGLQGGTTDAIVGPDYNVLTGHKIRCGLDTEDTTPAYGTSTSMVSNRVGSKAHSMQHNWSQYFKIRLPKGNALSVNTSRQCGQWWPSDMAGGNAPGGMVYIEQPSANDTNWDQAIYIGRIYVDKFYILKQMNYHAGQEQPVVDASVSVTTGDDYIGDETGEGNEADLATDL